MVDPPTGALIVAALHVVEWALSITIGDGRVNVNPTLLAFFDASDQ